MRHCHVRYFCIMHQHPKMYLLHHVLYESLLNVPLNQTFCTTKSEIMYYSIISACVRVHVYLTGESSGHV